MLSLRGVTQSQRISSTVARALGWALTDTSRVSSKIAPAVSADPRVSSHNELRYRNMVLGEYLAAPAARTVVSHVGTPVTDGAGRVIEDHALLVAAADDSAIPFVVLVRASDALLDASLALPANARGDRSRLTPIQLAGWRDQLAARVGELQRSGRGMVVDLPDGWVSEQADPFGREQLRWRAHLKVARQIVQELLHLSGLRTGFVARDPVALSLLSHDSLVPWH